MSATELTRRVALVEARHAPLLLALFDAASSGCHCQFWHFEGDDNTWLARCAGGSDNREAFGEAAREGREEARGLVALEGGEALGWLKLCPAPALTKLASRRVYRTLEHFAAPRDDVLVVACMLVHPRARRRGVARDLLRGAIEAGKTLGAGAIEAFPRVAAHALRDDELLMGPRSLFDEHGFVPVAGPDPYPVMRLELRTAP